MAAKTPRTPHHTRHHPHLSNQRAHPRRERHRPSPEPRGSIRGRRRRLLRKMRNGPGAHTNPGPDDSSGLHRHFCVSGRSAPLLNHLLLVVLVIVSSFFFVVPTHGAEEVRGDDDDCRASFDSPGADDGEKRGVVVVAGNSCAEEERGLQSRRPASNGPWRWEPDAPHRCDVRRIPYRDLATVFASTGGLVPKLYHEPIVIDYRNGDDDEHGTNDTDADDDQYNGEFARMTSLENITSNFDPGFEVTLSSSNSFSQHRRVVTLERYISETTSTETLPSHMSNETWYLFGETYTDPWVRLLDSYRLPPCQTCTRDLSALAFGIGNRGSGVQWHVHGPGFSESIHGRKHWVLYPPNDRPDYDANFTSRHWMEMVYPDLPRRRLPRECTLQPGEVIYFPDGWYHATVNLDDYTAFVSTFTTEHL